MEAFSLLKYWRSAGGASGGATTTTVFTADSAANPRATTKTIVSAAAAAVSPYSSDGEEGPYFDLEFALPADHDSDADENPSAKSQETDNEDETESGSDEEISVHENDDVEEEEEEDCTDQNATFSLSPSDEIFSQGNLVKIDENFKFPVSLVKSATKIRVLLLKLKKSKQSNNGDDDEANVQVSSTPKIVERESRGKLNRKFLAVKFRVEEVPILSLFTRDTSSKETINGGSGPKNNNNDNVEDSDEKKLTKEVVVQKYLKMVKPFYVRVSKLKFPGGGSKGCSALAPPTPEKGAAEAAASNAKNKQGSNNLQAGLEVVRKHLGKSRSASAAVAAAPPPGKAAANRRRDDSLLQVQDGIQGAILHCKRSFNAASGDVESSSILCRSVSDPSYEKSVMMQKALSSSPSSFSGEAKIE